MFNVVSSDRPFNHDVLTDSNSILVDPDNIDEISEAINKLYEDEKLRTTLADKALTDSQSLGIQQRAKNILKFIESKTTI